MFQLRPGNQRGHTQIGWLNSYHTFSFGEYYDPRFMGFSDLRVINDDVVAPGKGFGTHPHSNMEIISIVLEGALEHKDSLGTGSIIRPGEIQQMTAGTGVFHSEFNPSNIEPVHFLQIWIIPSFQDLKPKYEQKSFERKNLLNQLYPIVTPEGKDGTIQIYQDAEIYQSLIEANQVILFNVVSQRKYWIQVAQGSITVNDHPLIAGDGLAVSDEDQKIEIRGIDKLSNIILFNLRP